MLWKYKMDTGSENNLMHVNLYRGLVPNNIIADLKWIDKKVVLQTYKKACITLIGACNILIIHKNIKLSCSFFVVPGNGPALSGKPGCKDYNC